MNAYTDDKTAEVFIEGVKLDDSARNTKVTRVALGPWDKDEWGIISSWNSKYVFVRYGQCGTAAATLADELRWGWRRRAA